MTLTPVGEINARALTRPYGIGPAKRDNPFWSVSSHSTLFQAFALPVELYFDFGGLTARSGWELQELPGCHCERHGDFRITVNKAEF